MAFNSINFIGLFLPAFLLSYYFAKGNFRAFVVIIFSIAFYVFGNIDNLQNILVLILSVFVNSLFSIAISYKKNKVLTLIAIFFNIIILFLSKLNILFKTIPIGISFYIFHMISFHIDNSNSTINFNTFINYILFFPKLLSGPITRYKDFSDNLPYKDITLDSFMSGIFLFSYGLALKCVLSDNIYYIINQINTYGIDSISIFTAWIGVYSYTMRLYFDFAGYSLMAIGVSKIIGVNLPSNFNVPFLSRSVSEFWRRWHITLGHFFRDYVYIPLGGNFSNTNILLQSRNIIIVWLLTGIWHGMKINYIVWSMSICIVIICEKVFLQKLYIKSELIGRLIVIVFIPITFLVFSIEDIGVLSVYLKKLVDFETLNNARDFMPIFTKYYKVFFIGLVFMTNLPRKLFDKISKNRLLMVVLTILFIYLSINMINIGASDVFKYFAF